MTTHELKTWAPYYDAVARGEKTFEIRRDDRGFQKGDLVRLVRCVQGKPFGGWEVEWDPFIGGPKNTMEFKIGWVLTGGQFGLEPGYVAFSLERV